MGTTRSSAPGKEAALPLSRALALAMVELNTVLIGLAVALVAQPATRPLGALPADSPLIAGLLIDEQGSGRT
ncbi:MAG TPA: hypothetical protein VKT82_00535 [Ktedonobacterales bacterium]|nr:hypothetical protein [Ktedonobacterales bacterium]